MVSRHYIIIIIIIIIRVIITRARCSRAVVVRGRTSPISYDMCVSYYYNIHSPHVAEVAHANRIVTGVYYYNFHAGRGFVMVDGEIRSSNRELCCVPAADHQLKKT